jgi:hypothetical protein
MPVGFLRINPLSPGQGDETDNSVMVEELSVTCPHCGKRFASALQMDEETFSRIRIIEHIECCRQCGQANRFHKQDYYFFEVTESE